MQKRGRQPTARWRTPGPGPRRPCRVRGRRRPLIAHREGDPCGVRTAALAAAAFGTVGSAGVVASATSEIVGREREIAAVMSFLEAVERGPRALVLEGEAGVGKSTVWLEGVESA